MPWPTYPSEGQGWDGIHKLMDVKTTRVWKKPYVEHMSVKLETNM